uniref:Peptidase C1A papain C-terminal domain-containing protein n=1 Tax=Leptocylindrus danicus TaxID=163516 RepID=A0A7S2LQU4_9STRA
MRQSLPQTTLTALLLTLNTITTSTAAAPKHNELTNEYTFEQYITDFHKTYESSQEYERRRAIFETKLEVILAHNNRSDVTYKKGVNHFTDYEQNEGHFGHVKGLNNHAQSNTNANIQSPLASNAEIARALLSTSTTDDLPFDLSPVSELPKEVDWRTKGVVTAVKDQGSCGSCWAFAAMEALESHVALSTGTLFEFAPQELVSCMPNPMKCGGIGGCAGATVDLAFDFVMNNGGILEEFQMGYTSYYGKNGDCYVIDDDGAAVSPAMLRATTTTTTTTTSSVNDNPGPDPEGVKGAVATIEGYMLLTKNSYVELMNAVAKYGPVPISVAASPWKEYESGVFQMEGGYTAKNLDINHATVCVGYGTDEDTGLDYWLVRNSWKPTWGEGGYIRILREDPDEVDEDICGVDETPSHGSECIGGADSITVCGTSGILYENFIPMGGKLLI